ncbi:hypothetical protein ACFE04_006902 [Oxalis oulophora]
MGKDRDRDRERDGSVSISEKSREVSESEDDSKRKRKSGKRHRSRSESESNKRPEFTAWLSEVKKINLESLPNWEEKQMFKDFMEDHNTATFPSKKYYNLDAYYQRQMMKELKRGGKKVAETERTVFDDEEQRRLELMREREKQKEEQVEVLKRSMQSGMAQDMKHQALLREEMALQYKLGNYEAAAAIQRKLDPDVAMNLVGNFFACGKIFKCETYSNFEVVNNCPFTVWAAASPGGGSRLERGQTWSFNVDPGTKAARVWPRTNCNFDASGNGHCETGDCGGRYQCQGYGQHPNTLAEYSLNQYNNLDFFDISLIEGFNVGMDFSPKSNQCRGIRCSADINGMCPNELKTAGGCNNPCSAFGRCDPSDQTRFFKKNCPDAYSYPTDDQTSICVFTCPGGTNYKVVFCP